MGNKGCESSPFYRLKDHTPQFTVESRQPVKKVEVNYAARELFDPVVWEDLTDDFAKYSRFVAPLKESTHLITREKRVTTDKSGYGLLSVSPSTHTRATFLDGTLRLVGRRNTRLAYGGLSIKGCGLTGTKYTGSLEDNTSEPRGFYGTIDAKNELAVFNELSGIVKRYGLPTPPLDVPIGYISYDPKQLKQVLRELNEGERGIYLSKQIDKVVHNGDTPAILVRVMGSPERINFSQSSDLIARDRVLKSLQFLYEQDVRSFYNISRTGFYESVDADEDIIANFHTVMAERLRALLITFLIRNRKDTPLKNKLTAHVQSLGKSGGGPRIAGGFAAEKDVSTLGTICDFEELDIHFEYTKDKAIVDHKTVFKAIDAFTDVYGEKIGNWRNRASLPFRKRV